MKRSRSSRIWHDAIAARTDVACAPERLYVTASGTMRALGAEASDLARLVREQVEDASRAYLAKLVVAALEEERSDLPPGMSARVARKVAERFSLLQVEDARRAILEGLWMAIKAVHARRTPLPGS